SMLCVHAPPTEKMMPHMDPQKQKMLAGGLYDPSDEELSCERLRARTLCHELNSLTPAADAMQKQRLLASLFGYETDAFITPPFFCDYGYNISLGANAYFNFNCVVLDVLPVRIGSNALFGPGVHIYTASHPMTSAERRSGLE